MPRYVVKVRVEKVNGGVTFSLRVEGACEPPPERVARALDLAVEWYRTEVDAALRGAGLAGTGYARAFRRAVPRSDGPTVRVLDLEPWGFARKGEDGPVMGDTGSTPTEGRARHLAAYQAPLEEHHPEPGVVAFWRDLDMYELEARR